MTYSDLSQSPVDRANGRHSFDDTPAFKRGLGFLTALLLVIATIAVAWSPPAGAVSDDEELIRFGGHGSGPGQLHVPGGIATDPITGHVYTVETGNSRISEFTPWGNFVKAFGWDVAPGAVNEQQEVRVRASEGQFRLTFGAFTTADLPFGAPGAESEGPGSVEDALNALPSIGGVGGEVDVAAVSGSSDGKTPSIYVVAFKGSLAATNVTELTIANGTTPLDGGDPSTGFEVRTRADGTGGGAGLESCTAESDCKEGLEGSAAGQLGIRLGNLGVDAAGNVYLREGSNFRVQKFDSAGRFVLMFGGEVNKTTSGDICTLSSEDQCGAGVDGTGPGQFSEEFSSGIAPGAGSLFVADKDRIQRFNLQGEFEASIPVLGKQVGYVAFDPVSEDLYATYDNTVHRLDSTTGAEINVLEGQQTLATDLTGNVYAGGAAGINQNKVVQYDSAAKPLSPFTCCEKEPFIHMNGLSTNAVGNLYAIYFFPGGGGSPFPTDSFIRAFGPGPVAFEAPPPVPPTIVAQFATSVDRTGAVVGAEINPHFWTNTRFYVQYGTGKCSEGGCTSEIPLPPGLNLTTKPIDRAIKSSGIFLEGLKPGTTYHYRFVAESPGGGPVRGIGGEPGIDGEESSFTTYPAAPSLKADCQNQSFRTGFSAPLPDCRAFEMVSPIDKNNGDIKSLLALSGYTTNFERSSSDGSRFTYSSYRAFADPKAAPYTAQYMANRKDGVGWESESLTHQQAHAAADNSLFNFTNPYKAFSPDLCTGWLVSAAEPVLAPGATEGFPNLYRRDICGPADYEALIGVEPTTTPATFYFTEMQGTSADGEEALLQVKDQLTPDAQSGTFQTYYASDGQLRLVCRTPGGAPIAGNCSGGTGDGTPAGLESNALHRLASVSNAISASGDRVYWTDTGSLQTGPGKVYLRLNPGEEQSEVSGEECTEPEKACTVKVSETVSSLASRFLGASADGQRALFEVTKGPQEGSLFLFDSATASSTLLAGETRGVLGASEDLSRIYFVSEEALSGTIGATAGRPNLYLDEEGTKTFIATLAKDEVTPGGLAGGASSNTASVPVYHVARVSPDGSHLAFISSEALTGYDNTDQLTGQADVEVYLYEANSAGPVCVSCNPGGARPIGRIFLLYGNDPKSLPAAAMLPVAQNIHHFPRTLSADGSRVFFNSFDALLPRDANGKADVYQWQAAGSAKECTERGAELYVEDSEGCLSLISSGQSPDDSEFSDATPSGNDVFFTTNASLLPQDPGLIDVYDARANGGLPPPPAPPGPCQGDACQFAPPPPTDPTPSSASFKGAGNLRAKAQRRCGKGKARRKGRCVARKRKRAKQTAQHKRAANHNRRQSR